MQSVLVHTAIIFVTIASLLQQISLSIYYTCNLCTIAAVINAFCLPISRTLNILFFIRRAKAAQGIQPILSKKWFDTILPRIFFFLCAVLVIVGVMYAVGLEFGECAEYANNIASTSSSHCEPIKKDTNIGIVAWIGI